ncbi:hypothetical protein ACQEU3_37530 [Spirillospora sp. CA-253888]
MELYYDAHLYVANWGTHRLMLRLPRPALALGTVAAQASPPMTASRSDPRAIGQRVRKLSPADKDRLLLQVAQGHGARVQMELLGHLPDTPDVGAGRPRRTVAQLLDTASDVCQERQR